MTKDRVALVCTWRPHGELPRLLRLLPQLRLLYSDMVVAIIDGTPEISSALAGSSDVVLIYPEDGAHSRMAALAAAAGSDANWFHYCDMDRLLRWSETQPEELYSTIKSIPSFDCLILGRTKDAYDTHPLAMLTTERIINDVASHLLGCEADICAGSKGLSRSLIHFLLRHAPLDGWGDVSWAVLAKRGGFTLSASYSDGLDYETADRHQPFAADQAAQRRLAAAIDADPLAWQNRVRVAQEIVSEGLRSQFQLLDMS